MLDLIGINRNTKTAGPGIRLEYFLKGCIRGITNPCEGCFNEDTWTFSGGFRRESTESIVEHAKSYAHNGLITFCGGEPLVQGKALIEVVKGIKKEIPDSHIIVYTAYDMKQLLKKGLSYTWKNSHGSAVKERLIDYDLETKENHFELLSPSDVKELMSYVDLIVDGDFQLSSRLTNHDTMHEGWFIGSGNQRVIYCKETLEQDCLVYDFAQTYNDKLILNDFCIYCGSAPKKDDCFCSTSCKNKYKEHVLS